MKTIKQVYKINAPISNVWKALVDPKIIDKWGGGPAQIDEKVGTKFSLWGGDIHGKNIEIVPNKKLVQEWFGGDWKNPSRAIFTLTEIENGTELSLLHEDVPDEEVKEIDEGWKIYYLGPLKKLLEK